MQTLLNQISYLLDNKTDCLSLDYLNKYLIILNCLTNYSDYSQISFIFHIRTDKWIQGYALNSLLYLESCQEYIYFKIKKQDFLLWIFDFNQKYYCSHVILCNNYCHQKKILSLNRFYILIHCQPIYCYLIFFITYCQS